MKSLSLGILLFSISIGVFGQTAYSDLDLQEYIESIFATQDLDINYDDLYETFLQFSTNPININNANREDLRSLYILSNEQIDSLESYTIANGNLLSLYELQAVPSFDPITIRKLLPFITITNAATDQRPLFQRIITEKNNYLFLRYERSLQDKRGYLDSAKYLGDPGKVYARFRVSKSKDFSIGFTAEKDAGEQFIWDKKRKQYGMDFYSFHVQVQNKGYLKNLIIGDYRLQFGQGLILNSGFNIGKGSETITTTRKYSLGAMPYTSVLESGYFRGSTATYSLNHFDITGFASITKRDASIQNDEISIEFDEFINSLQNTGFHRTENELNNKNQIEEVNYGGSVEYTSNSRDFQVGTAILQTQYDRPIIRTANYYNGFEFSGSQNTIGSLFGSYQWHNLNLFGEMAMSSSEGRGGIAGAIVSLTHQLDLAIVARHYDKNFHSFYGGGFGENTRNINESGMYWGIKYQPLYKLKLSAYYDQFKFPWLKYRVKAPSDGYEFLIKAEYAISRKIKVYGQYRQETKSSNHRDENVNIDQVLDGVKSNYILNADYESNDNLSFKSRVQFSSYQFNNITTYGFAAMQDITATIDKFKLSARYAIFQTDDYDNRQYVYEKDVLYAFSIPAYSGIGSRAYLMLQYKLSKRLQFWARYANTLYTDRNSIGSGNEEIIGNRKSDIKLQVKISF